jgi:trimethylamine--corrinoid protein Co-methyltransferase
MRPTLRLLGDDLIRRIIAEARDLLARLGVEIHNAPLLSMLADQGVEIDRASGRAFLGDDTIDRALEAVPGSFRLYDAFGRETHDFSGMNVHFTPGSVAIRVLDHDSVEDRKPLTSDYVSYVKLVSQLPNIASQSTAILPADVHEGAAESYRLFLGLMFCEKPVVTGAFTIEGLEVMRDLQLAVRGSEEALRQKPLTIFSCCPTAPLKWSDVTSQNVVDCARAGIPVEYISMPLSGFVAPVTLVGTLVQHTAETLSGLVISQLTQPGAPVLYGGSPAVFDVRHETTPMGAIETMMVDCAYNEIGKHLGLPTQAYISLSDAKLLDAQAGLESSMGATLAVLAGINNVAGPGMLDFESCFSLEKLLLDNEICGMALRLARGIEPREDFPALPHFEELLSEKHLLIADHTRRYLKTEHYVPGPVIDRANSKRWRERGSLTLNERAHSEVQRLIGSYEPHALEDSVRANLTDRMLHEARRHGMTRLPELPV